MVDFISKVGVVIVEVEQAGFIAVILRGGRPGFQRASAAGGGGG